jgi:ankyrin repeat protein
LLAHGANINARSDEGKSPLHRAVISSDFRNANNAKNVVSQLLAHGADLNLMDKDGTTILQVARQNPQRFDLVALLKQAGAKK